MNLSNVKTIIVPFTKEVETITAIYTEELIVLNENRKNMVQNDVYYNPKTGEVKPIAKQYSM